MLLSVGPSSWICSRPDHTHELRQLADPPLRLSGLPNLRSHRVHNLGWPSVMPSERLVPVGPLREAFWASGMTLSEVCYRLGWNDRNRAQTSRLQRLLGIAPYWRPNGRHYIAKNIDRDRAVPIAVALNLDPVDLGL